MNNIHKQTLELLKKHFDLIDLENGIFVLDLSEAEQDCKATIDLTGIIPQIKYEFTANVLSYPSDIKSRLSSFKNAADQLRSNKFAKTDPFCATLQAEIS